MQYQNLHQLLLNLELARACLVFLSCLPLLTKPPFVCQITVRMCLFVTSTLAKQVTAHPTVQVTFLQTKCTTVVTVNSFPHRCYLYFAVSDFIECNMKFILAQISPTDWYLLKYKVFPARRIWKNISIYKWPCKGAYRPYRYFNKYFKVSVGLFCIS